MDTVRGTLMGLQWIELPVGTVPGHYLVEMTRDRNGPVVMITTPDRIPEKWIDRIQHGEDYDSGWSSYMKSHNTLRPFDEAAAFPHARVCYYSHGFDSFDVDAWARTVIDVPDSIDVTFDYEHYTGKLGVSARTMRNGAVTMVRRKIGTHAPFAQVAGGIIGYFERNCPRVPDDLVVGATCGTHVNRILSGLNQMGAQTVERWLERPLRDERHPDLASWQSSSAARKTLRITPEMMPHQADMVTLSLIRNEQSTAVRCDFTMKGPHRVADDLQGSTVTLNATFPDTVMNALKGRDLADVISVEWARGMTIRTARREDGNVILRTFSEQEALMLPDVVDDPAEIERQLRLLVESGEDSMRWIDEDARPVLASLTPGALLAVMTTLKATQRAELADHGAPGWVLRSGMTGIEVESCPIGEMKDVVYGVLGKR